MFSSILKLVVIVGCLFVCDEILKVLNSTVVCTLALILWQCQLPQWMKYCNFKFLNRFIYSWFLCLYDSVWFSYLIEWVDHYRYSWNTWLPGRGVSVSTRTWYGGYRSGMASGGRPVGWTWRSSRPSSTASSVRLLQAQ